MIGFPYFLRKLYRTFFNDMRYGVDVVTERTTPQTGCFQGYGATTGKRIRCFQEAALVMASLKTE